MKEVDRRHAYSLVTAWSFLRRRRADPNADPNAETTGQYWADTADRPPSRKHAKAPESVAEQRFPARIVSSHAGGHWFESSSLHHEKNLGNLVFPRFFSFLIEFSMSACDGHFAVLCFPMLPCFRSQAVLSCTPFVPWEPYKYLRFTVMSSDNIGSICCSCALTASALRLGV